MQRATGPRLLRDCPWQRGSNPDLAIESRARYPLGDRVTADFGQINDDDDDYQELDCNS